MTKEFAEGPPFSGRPQTDAEWKIYSDWLRELEAGLEQELKDVGINVKSYRYIIDKPKNYKFGIPILVRHMHMDKYPDNTRNFMAQAIAMKDANPYWDTIRELFLSVVGKKEFIAFEQGLAVALARSCKEPQLQTLISMCEDQRLGFMRALLILALKNSRDPRAEVALMKLATDPQFGTEVSKWIKKREKRRIDELRVDRSKFN